MEAYDFLAYCLGLLVFFGALILTPLKAAREPTFWVSKYPFWMAIAVGCALVAPALYTIGSPVEISLSDAYLLRQRYVGWRSVLVSYGLVGGLALGGVIGYAVRAKG